MAGVAALALVGAVAHPAQAEVRLGWANSSGLDVNGLAGDNPESWIPARDEALRLNPLVTTDHDLLHHRLTWALDHRDEPHAAIPVLAAGLDLVTGTPSTAR